MSAAPEPRWTPQQKAAVEHTDGALLVSAAAGSGKTAVLAARCAYLVCDAAEPCDVDELLVLTFTRAAAAEMKERIDAAIRRRAARPDAGERILRQLRLIDRAPITTIDAFCGQLVREHFHLVGVDPGFAMLAPEDASLLRNDTAADLIEGEFDAPDAATFRTLLDGYFSSDVDRLRQQVISAHTLSQSIVDPAAWISASLDRLRDGAASTNSELMASFSQVQQRAIRSAIQRLDQIAVRADVREGLQKYAAHARELRVELDDWRVLSGAGDFGRLAERAGGYKSPRLPIIPKETPGKEAIQGEIDAVKKRIKSGDLDRLVRWTTSQLQGDLRNILPLAERFFDLMTRFTAAYDRAKRSLRSLDFADVESMALRILSGSNDAGGVPVPSSTAIAMQARYRHVLVDEFQDINPLQYALLRLVSRDRSAELSTAEQSNLFSVGDVKQSIYRFRLAEPQQFIDRRASLNMHESSLGRVIDLQENFRSRAPLLEAINDVFRRLMTDESTRIAYDPTHELRSIADYAPVESPFFAGKPIELHVLPREAPSFDETDEGSDTAETDSFEREVEFVAKRVRKLVEVEKPNVTVKGEGGVVTRRAKYGDIVVLLRSAKYKSSQVADALRVQGIPVHSDDATGFFNAVEIQDVLSVLRVLSNGRQDVPLAAVLRSPFFSIQAREDALARVRIAFPEETFHRAVERYAKEHENQLAGELQHVLKQLAMWRRAFRERPVGDALRDLIEHNGFSTFCRARVDGAQRFANLTELLARGEAFDAFERQGLDRFLVFLEELEASDELGRPSLGAESDDVVRVMTVHKSKGLEFPIVVIPDLGKRFNVASLNDPILLDRDLGIGMTSLDLRRRIRYPSAASIVVRDHARRQAVAEEVRVLYVALTRAREHLILVGSAKEDACCGWTEDWAEHEGALPDVAVQGAATALDWIGPIAAMTERAGLGTFKLVDHTTASETPEDGDTVGTGGQPSAPAAIVPSEEKVTIDDPAAMLAISRIEYHYPHAAAVAQRATMRVTDFVSEALPGVQRPHGPAALAWPAAYRALERASAVDVGSATHVLLQLLDFRDVSTPDAVRAQAKRLVERRLMSEADAALVDVESIAWFASSELGQQITRDDATLLREQSLAIAMPALGRSEVDEDSPDRNDRVLVRGRIDALLRLPSGLTLIDYKSDRVAPEDLGVRSALYAPQLLGYANALREISGESIERACLVFLNARVIRDVPLKGGAR